MPAPGPGGPRAGAATVIETVADSGTLAIDGKQAVVRTRKLARRIAGAAGFDLTDTARIVTVASGLARSVHRDTGRGHMAWRALSRDGRDGLELVFVGAGGGNRSAAEVAGAERLMDEVDVSAAPGEVPTVTVRKWLR